MFSCQMDSDTRLNIAKVDCNDIYNQIKIKLLQKLLYFLHLPVEDVYDEHLPVEPVEDVYGRQPLCCVVDV